MEHLIINAHQPNRGIGPAKGIDVLWRPDFNSGIYQAKYLIDEKKLSKIYVNIKKLINNFFVNQNIFY
ncbi:MAG: hypothetical protein JJU21_18145 [Salinarimonas sp.]|nr:hypothetical protein [Salinarimonas sp.]